MARMQDAPKETAAPHSAPAGTGAAPPVTIPILAATQEKLAQGQYAAAVAAAYHRVVLDLQKAYGLSLPAQWTHREFLSEYLRDDMGEVTVLVERLYRLYEPVRYGSSADWSTGDVLGLLRAIYAEPAMRDLYRRLAPTPSEANGFRPQPGTDDPFDRRPAGLQ